MAYRNPRFMIDHIFRAFPVSYISGPELAGFPKRRLTDGRNRSLWRGTDATADQDVVLSSDPPNLVPTRPPIERVLIPQSREAWLQMQRIRLFAGPGATPASAMAFDDGVPADLYAAPDVLDFEVVAPADAQRLRVNFVGIPGASTFTHEAGQVYASRILTTSSGVVQSWTDEDEPNVDVVTTEAGCTYARERGDPRRVWRLRYRLLDDADMFVLDTVRRTAGIQVHGFWFDPPTSGDNPRRWFTMEDPNPAGSWGTAGPVNLSFITDAASNPADVEPYARVVYTATGPNEYIRAQLDFDTPQDLRGKLLRFDLRCAGAFANAIDGVLVGFHDTAGVAGEGAYFRTRVHALQGADSTWRRFFVDPALSDPSTELTTGDVIDWSSVRSVAFAQQNDTQFQTVNWSRPTIIDKAEQPAFVELMEFRKEQASGVPKARRLWDVEILLREVLS